MAVAFKLGFDEADVFCVFAQGGSSTITHSKIGFPIMKTAVFKTRVKASSTVFKLY
jgi:hypothetical protein